MYKAVEDAKMQYLYGNKSITFYSNYNRVVALFFVRRHIVVDLGSVHSSSSL